MREPVNERARIIAFLRHLEATAINEQSRGAYAYAAEAIERREHKGGRSPSHAPNRGASNNATTGSTISTST